MQRATRKSSKTPKSSSRAQSARPSRNFQQPKPASAEAVRKMLEAHKALRAREQRMADSDARIERREREGITLRGKRLEQAERIVSDCTMAAISTKELVVSAICASTRDEAGAILTALENQSMWITRRLDVLSVLLGSPGAGNFMDDLVALTEERAAELEREEAEND